MKKTRLKSLLLAVAFTLITAFSSLAWDKQYPDPTPFASVNDWRSSFAYPKVTATGTAMGIRSAGFNKEKQTYEWQKREVAWSTWGSSYVLKDGFAITAAHVVIPSSVVTPKGPYSGFRSTPFKVLTTNILLWDYSSDPHPAKVWYIDRIQDIAILQYSPDNPALKSPGYFITDQITAVKYPYPTAPDTYGMEQGDVLVMVTHKRGEDGELLFEYSVKTGKVLSPHPLVGDESAASSMSIWDFVTDIQVEGGDSGSPVFAFYQGKPVFVGILNAQWGDGPVTVSIAAHIGQTWRYMNFVD